MQLDLRQLPHDGLSFERSLDLPDLRGDQGAPLLVGQARLTGHAKPGARGVDLGGRLEATVELECSRCLEPYRQRIRADFLLCVLPDREAAASEEEAAPGEHELVPEDASLFRSVSGKVDLRTVAAEQILLNLPLKPICGVDCAGLCPTCGVNRNRIECGCRGADVDPRLAPLLDLKKHFDGS